MANDHYVSKFQLRGWLPEKKHKVLVYLRDHDRLEWIHPQKLFAVEGLNPADVEARLNQLIESPLTQHRSELFTTAPASGGVIPVKQWRAVRAAWLLVLLQCARSSAALGLPGGTSISEYMRWTDEKLDQFVQAATINHDLRLVRDPNGRQMLPSLGMFAVPVADPACITGISIGHVCPISPEYSLIFCSKTAVTASEVPKTLSLEESLSLASFGSGPHITKLVVPPSRLGMATEKELKSWIRECLPAAAGAWQALLERRRIVIDQYRSEGFTVERLPSGPERWRVTPG